MTGSVLAASVFLVALRVLVAIVVAVVTTVVSLRLLGMRRGWVRGLVAGVAGWGVGFLLALSLADWDWGSDDLFLHALAIGIPATMGVAVALDLLARPGSLSIGERAGLVVAPRPFRAMQRRVAVVRRYRELLRIARREGFGPFIKAGARTDDPADTIGIRTRRVLESAGGVYIKLGQIAATRVDILPPEVCEELAALQNRVAPEPVELVRAVLEEELGGAVDDVFAEFDWEPLASASIGQTYRAVLRSGERVVVKVQRPGIAEVMERDLAALSLLAGLAQRRTPFGQDIRSGELLDQFATSLRAELDFRREADAMEEMTALLGPESPVRVPRTHRELCTRRLLVQEQFDGFTVADTQAMAVSGVDRDGLAERLLACFLEQILRMGFFHADPHPGNIFVFADGTLGLIDLGAVGRLDPIQQAAVIDMIAALAHRDVGLLRDGIERVAELSETESPQQLERALARLMADNIRATGSVDPAVLQDLVAVLARFGIRLPADLVVLSRAIVTLDGTLRVISPGVSLVAAASELMAAPDSQIIDPQALLREELTAALPQLRRLPDRIDRILTLTGRGDLRIRHVVDEDGRRIVRTLANRALLCLVGFTLLVVSAVLLVADDAGPKVADGTGLFEVLGYVGLLAGIVLQLRVVAAIARDGTT
jgi:ubiquinone biosynthesis protein